MSRSVFHCFLFFLSSLGLAAQQVPVNAYAVDNNGQVHLTVNSTEDHYYIVKIRHGENAPFDWATSMTLGEANSTELTERVGSYPEANYQVLEYENNAPADTDGDGLDDIFEYERIPLQSPLNAALQIDEADGYVAVDNFSTFKALSVSFDFVQWNEFLNGKAFVKFLIADFHTAQPKVYFIHSDNHPLHADFADAIGVELLSPNTKRGQIIYHPATVSPNGTLGTFAFNFSGGHGDVFEDVQKTFELLSTNMFFLNNNFSYLITNNTKDEFARDSLLYAASRIPILKEDDLYAGLDYLGLNEAEGYGYFRQMDAEDLPSAKDIVLYETIPNALPRVAGIVTSVIQTPLSHVNLRAIQDGVPNAYIRDPLQVDSIAELLDKPIYFKVEQGRYIIREATLEEVDAWFEDIRPKQEQVPSLNLDFTDILPLDSIRFGMFDGFGAKCANVGEMRMFGFPDGTIPDGFGVPFYFYHEFMTYNGFFHEVETMLKNSDFQSDRAVRDAMLDDFRDKIKDADMPQWMLDELGTMHNAFPAGMSIRCRSSTNTEDLPNFNGAGLYTSKTQHPDEGHISKSIKQVYASLWNLRAFEEREFYRINHFKTAMGVLCHPNFSDEKANGVAVSTDPLYNTDNTFYLNSQVGEDLITNPNGNTIPEEILLDKTVLSGNDFVIVQRSNMISSDSMILAPIFLDQMRDFLSVIHDKFEVLYGAQDNPYFAMEIEYKITSDDRLSIKQARPWVTYLPQGDSIVVEPPVPMYATFHVFPNPTASTISIDLKELSCSSIHLFDWMGRRIRTLTLGENTDSLLEFDLSEFPSGVYVVCGLLKNGEVISRKVVRR